MLCVQDNVSVSHCNNHLLALLELVAGGDGSLVMSVLLDEVAPHLPSCSAIWLPGDGLRTASLEWCVISLFLSP